jgi:hypothetical protein
MSGAASRANVEQARQNLPLRRLMEERGRGPANGNWKQFPQCPYCAKDSAGVFAAERGERFKCHHTSCPSGTGVKGGAWDEVGFLAFELKLSRREAFILWLKEAGVWRGREPDPPGVGPGPMPEEDDLPPTEPEAVDRAEGPSCGASADEKSVAVDSPLPGDGLAAVPPTPLPFDGSVSASPAGEPTLAQPDPGEAPLSSAAEAPGKSDAEGVQTSAPEGCGLTRREAVEAIRELLRVPPGSAPERLSAAMKRAEALAAEYQIDLNSVEQEQPENEPPPRVVEAIRYFWQRIPLTPEDAEKLWRQRGILPRIGQVTGLKSSPRSNEKVLLEMKEQFPMAVLLDSCLWTKDDTPGAEPRPNRQFFGWGVLRQTRNAQGEDEEEWGWSHPILFAYANEAGEVIDLRPHKRTQKGQAARLYVPRQLKEHRQEWAVRLDPQFTVFTEGEFKALALWQALPGKALFAALPGITMSKQLWSDIEELVEKPGQGSQIIVVFDNEDKSTPGAPKYQEERWKRFDSEIWARYLARRLAGRGYTTKVGHLPDAWRDRNLKADWDGALRLLIEQSGAKGRTAEEIWAGCGAGIAMAFMQVLRSAVRHYEVGHTGLYSRADEALIESKVLRYSYEPNLPCGGDEEARISKRLRRLATKLVFEPGRLPEAARAFLRHLGDKYNELPGRYYVFHELHEAKREMWKEYKARAAARDDVEVKRACEIVLRGVPAWVSDFYVDPLFVLEKVDGTRDRVVRVHTLQGRVTPRLYWPAEAYSAPNPFRIWLANAASVTWGRGITEQTKLQYDMNYHLDDKEVKQIPLRGYHEPSGLYFFEDTAITPEGKMLLPDRHGVFWHQGQGYLPSELDAEGQEFPMGLPRMHPHTQATDQEIRDLWRVVCRNYYEAVGDYGAWMLLGNLVSYGAAVEIFKRYCCFPGLWTVGLQESGKTSLIRWGVRIWGYTCHEGLVLGGSTRVGVKCALAAYGWLPVWLEEFQVQNEDWVTEVVKSVFDHVDSVKKTFGEPRRLIRAGSIVTGMATHSDPQVMSRYCTVRAVAAKRLNNEPERLLWFEDTSLAKFFLLGRHILTHRAEFAKSVMQQLQAWVQLDVLSSGTMRAKIVQGAAYASFMAMAALLESHTSDELNAFRQYALERVAGATNEVREKEYSNQFWGDLVAAVKANELGFTAAERGKYLKAVPNPDAPCPVSEYQRKFGEDNPHFRWKSVKLYVSHDAVDLVAAYKKKIGSTEASLSKTDLRAAIKDKPYNVPAENSTRYHRQRFVGGGLQYCFCVDLDRHELGLVRVTDAQFDASLRKGDGMFFPDADWEDPRKGPLFYLVESLQGGQT